MKKKKIIDETVNALAIVNGIGEITRDEWFEIFEEVYDEAYSHAIREQKLFKEIEIVLWQIAEGLQPANEREAFIFVEIAKQKASEALELLKTTAKD